MEVVDEDELLEVVELDVDVVIILPSFL